ncbi:hypothetical protein ACGF7U_04210 [Micromonospora sp. NPDC047670]|uniref:hypothetical protein n=1 Tax=Micromonospora sp. NPDC047670 TaxID=3364252 RepID=UPI00371A8413
MPDAIHDDLLADFTPAQPYTTEVAATAPRSPGVHVVIEDSKVTLKPRFNRQVPKSRRPGDAAG